MMQDDQRTLMAHARTMADTLSTCALMALQVLVSDSEYSNNSSVDRKLVSGAPYMIRGMFFCAAIIGFETLKNSLAPDRPCQTRLSEKTAALVLRRGEASLSFIKAAGMSIDDKKSAVPAAFRTPVAERFLTERRLFGMASFVHEARGQSVSPA